MASTSATELAQEVLRRCLNGEPWQSPEFEELLSQALSPDTAHEASRALFGVLVEGLADRFEPRLCDAYAELFTEAVGRVLPEVWPGELLARYQRVREAWPFEYDDASVQHIFVLSRVTLGADVVVTSTIMAGLKARFPHARLHFVGPRKNYELFAADERIEHLPLDYRRGGTLTDRLQVWPELQTLLQAPNSLVVDPDSRYTQLGLLPVGASDDRYFFFESRAIGAESDETLVALTQRWLRWTFEITGAEPYVALDGADPKTSAADVCVSLGVGENESKRVPDPFEADLLALLADGRRVCVDFGASAVERARVERASRGLANVTRWSGSFASFAAEIRRAGLYVGYDSAGQHVAAACGVPLISVFAGEVSERMFARWRPSGAASCEVVRVAEERDPLAAVARRL